VAGKYLDDVLADFSGYIAADELYDGPFRVLSIVDNRTFRRITYEVLDHDPTHADMERFFREFQAALQHRGLVLRGITTDASALYPEPICRVFGDVPHQVCEFHVIKELTKAVLRAVAKVRKELAATKPKLGRGRPSSATARQAARRRKRIDEKVGDLFKHRYLFVQHQLTRAQRRTLSQITRGQPELRTLRGIMDEVYPRFDRRCRTDTALEKLARLRRRVRRFKKIGKILQKLFSPNLEKALTFLDDTLLPYGLLWTCSASNGHKRAMKRLERCTPLAPERPRNPLQCCYRLEKFGLTITNVFLRPHAPRLRGESCYKLKGGSAPVARTGHGSSADYHTRRAPTTT
jgi:hypothetical protein